MSVKMAVAGLTPEQAAWKDESDNHSIAQLVNYLIFWNQQQLAKFKGEKPAAFSGDNGDESTDSADYRTTQSSGAIRKSA